MKTNVVIGASPDPSRYSYRAAMMLQRRDEPVVAVGTRKGKIGELDIHTDKPAIGNVGTITLYVGPQNQAPWYDYILSLKPERIIMNPGAENPELQRMAEKQGVEVLNACTLVMLSVGTF